MPRIALFVLVALLTVSCEGPIGPTGPQGTGGPQGPGGPQGETGEPFDGVRLLRVRISRTACLV